MIDNIIIKEKNPNRIETINRFIMLLKKEIRLTTLVEFKCAIRNDLMKLREILSALFNVIVSTAVIR